MAGRLGAQGGREVTRALWGFPGAAGGQQTSPHHVLWALSHLAQPRVLPRSYSRVGTGTRRVGPLGRLPALPHSSRLQGRT